MAAERRDIQGTVIAVTGAGSGIGEATTQLLLEAGANVVLGDNRPDSIAHFVEEWGGDRVIAVEMDVRDPDGATALVAAAVDGFGRLDSLVANAGTGFFGGITDWSDDDIRKMFDVNSLGTIWAIRAAVRQFDAQGDGGDVVFIASVAGLGSGGGYEAVYSSTKFSQVGLAISLSREVRERGIRVSTIAPAAVATNFAHGTGRTPGDPVVEDYLLPSDVGFAVQTVLEQPRRMRTALWTLWSMAEKENA